MHNDQVEQQDNYLGSDNESIVEQPQKITLRRSQRNEDMLFQMIMIYRHESHKITQKLIMIIFFRSH